MRGQSAYLDDIPLREGALYAVVLGSPIAHGKLLAIHAEEAAGLPGVLRIFSAADIPGENQTGGIIPDEPLLADGELHFQGQPVCVIVAQDELTARRARRLIRLEYETLPAVTDVEEAHRNGQYLSPPRTFRLGDTEQAWAQCAHITEGMAATGGQEHVYIETQGAYAYPEEGGRIKIVSSTQGPTAVQRTAARILGLPMQRVGVEVTRLGGGFGGKEDQATPWACMAALAAYHLQRPVKLVLHRADDMRMTGKRNPYRSRFRIGLSKDLDIIAFEAEYLQDGGAAADLSPAILERTLFHANNSYYIPNVQVKAYSCRTHTVPNTAFRGFGGPQGMFVIEAAIAKAAWELSVPPYRIQQRNLLQENDEFPYGQRAEQARARACWSEADTAYHLAEKGKAVEAFNRNNAWVKKGLAAMPVCFGISFTNTFMNQAGALVHIYHDGSIGISSAAVEMGQGVNTKLVQVAAHTLSINPARIRIEPTDTTRVANTSPTAASAGADLNGKAVIHACEQLLERLRSTAAELLQADPDAIEISEEQVLLHGSPSAYAWPKLVEEAFRRRVNLSAQGYYATPGIHFDKQAEKGRPFAYHTYGTAFVTVKVDCLRGTYAIDEVAIVHDFGNSINPIVDRGQVDGGVVQGIGWMTCEEVAYTPEGRLMSNSLSAYKAPDLHAAPARILCTPLEAGGPPAAILRSKAVGEPPLMYGIGAFFAIQDAVRAFNPAYRPELQEAPFTPERVLMALYEGQD